jgi:hypothetical protein
MSVQIDGITSESGYEFSLLDQTLRIGRGVCGA